MTKGENKLTEETKALLRQGTKVKFKWHGNSDLVYEGRIETRDGTLYWCAEHNYDGKALTSIGEGMQYYNSLESFHFFTMFEILT